MADQQPTQQTRLIRQALTDQAFRQRLKRDPKAALKEHGITVPESVTVRVHEADATTVHLVLPALPPASELTPTPPKPRRSQNRPRKGGSSKGPGPPSACRW